MTTDDIESQGKALVGPLLASWSRNGIVIDTNHARSPVVWQRTFGDYLILCPSGGLTSVEVKTERVFTGNLFIETYSNRSGDHLERRGWLDTLQADAIVYVFLDARAAFSLPFGRLRKWCIADGNLWRRGYREKLVHRSENGSQRNQTLGYPVPLAHLLDAGLKCFRLTPRGTWEKCTLGDVSGAPVPQQAG